MLRWKTGIRALVLTNAVLLSVIWMGVVMGRWSLIDLRGLLRVATLKDEAPRAVILEASNANGPQSPESCLLEDLIPAATAAQERIIAAQARSMRMASSKVAIFNDMPLGTVGPTEIARCTPSPLRRATLMAMRAERDATRRAWSLTSTHEEALRGPMLTVEAATHIAEATLKAPTHAAWETSRAIKFRPIKTKAAQTEAAQLPTIAPTLTARARTVATAFANATIEPSDFDWLDDQLR